MIEQNNFSRGIRILIGAAAFVTIIVGINFAQSVVVLLLVSIFLAILGAPAVLWLKKKHIPSILAVLIVMSAMIIILVLIGAQIGTSVSSFSDEIPLLQSRIREQFLNLSVILSRKGFVVNEKFFLEYIN